MTLTGIGNLTKYFEAALNLSPNGETNLHYLTQQQTTFILHYEKISQKHVAVCNYTVTYMKMILLRITIN